ncbi:MAG: DUF4920 domain-containing protein [Saprospiraceae bacterium]|nr:DUF4920 domain-containing protein [Bacteroidia bacterium]MBT8229662.1 DUF4920 domain-containing protein [Bacteroidia bacterium]NNF22093.1 DUF4920 domain-containing protein [Saprospiraceae bacterium]NNK89425.1 DUF4920 domain-containing protein [Saprospiraceae bacterium]
MISACKKPAQPLEENGYKYFGEKIDKVEAISFNDLMSKIETQDSVYTQVEAQVEAVCQTKGCWMNLVDANNVEGASIFVKFKDYGFFMPKDIAGQKVIVEGVAYKEITTVDELKHYAEDEGLSQEEIDAITEPEEELKFMANGVILL